MGDCDLSFVFKFITSLFITFPTSIPLLCPSFYPKVAFTEFHCLNIQHNTTGHQILSLEHGAVQVIVSCRPASLITTLCEWLQNSPPHLGYYNHPTDSFSSSSFVKGLYFLSSHDSYLWFLESTFFSWLLIVFPITTAPRNYYSERLFKVLFFPLEF